MRQEFFCNLYCGILAPAEERSLLLEPLRELVAKVSELFGRTHVTTRPEIKFLKVSLGSKIRLFGPGLLLAGSGFNLCKKNRILCPIFSHSKLEKIVQEKSRVKKC